MKKKIVLALGGNALIKKGQKGTISEQFDNTIESVKKILPLIRDGHKIIITHGNGPTVGHMMARVEAGLEYAPYIPLGICVADSQGSLGFMIGMCLHNILLKAGIKREIIPLITPVLVSADDETLKNPSKPIGSFYTRKEAEKMKTKHEDWTLKEDSGRGWRRVVPSPMPMEIINKEIIKKMVEEGYIIIAAGGGGIPVIHREDGTLKGIPAVIDKDRTAAILARDIEADTLIIMTAVDKVYLNYGSKNQKGLNVITIKQAKKYLSHNHFPAGSMGPKIEAAITFLEQGGKEVIICALEELDLALAAKSGTKILN
ncbi:carbamate kinase [Patescibacteria group bacterium]|nr:carbamate kinase [Patescibacteria group bacterium]